MITEETFSVGDVLRITQPQKEPGVPTKVGLFVDNPLEVRLLVIRGFRKGEDGTWVKYRNLFTGHCGSFRLESYFSDGSGRTCTIIAHGGRVHFPMPDREQKQKE